MPMINFSLEELYAIERAFDHHYSVMLNQVIALDRAKVEIHCFMDKENPERAELLKKNAEQEKIVAQAFILYHGIAKACEKIRKESQKEEEK
jgi:lipopolysaccharide biosynthesis glycosyltransferase